MVEQNEHSAIVEGLRAGTNEGLAAFYDLYADKLYDFARRQLRDASLAADVVHDTVLIVRGRIGQLRDDSKFRAWVYAIVRNEVRAKARARSRLVREEYAPEQSVDPDFAGDHDRRELASLVDEAVAGLTEREQEVFHLFARQSLSTDEIAASLELTFANAQKLVQRVRDRIARSAGALLVARQGRKECNDLNVLLVDWDGTFSPLWRKRIARHVDECATCERRRAVFLQPGGAVMAAPFLAAPESLRSRIFDSVAAGIDVGLSSIVRPPFLRRPAVLSTVAGVAFLALVGVVANRGSESPQLLDSSAPVSSITSPGSLPVDEPTASSVPATSVNPGTALASTSPVASDNTSLGGVVKPSGDQGASPGSTLATQTVSSTVPAASPGTAAAPTAGEAQPTPTATVAASEPPATPSSMTAPAASPTPSANPGSNSPSKIVFNACSNFGRTTSRSFAFSVKITDPQAVSSARMQLVGASKWHPAGSFGNGIWFAAIDKIDVAATKATVIVEATDKAGALTTAQFAVYPATCP